MSHHDGRGLPPSGLGLGLQAVQRQPTTTKPVNMRQPYNNAPPAQRQMGTGPMLASSAPVYDNFILPRAPVPRPRASMAEPPPMSLPPSPPVFAPVQQQPAGGKQPSSRNPAVVSRSLSNNPTFDYLSAIPAKDSNNAAWPSAGDTIDELDELNDDKTVSDYMDDLPPQGRLGRQTSAQQNNKQQLNRLDSSQLGTSPTVFSMLSGKPNNFLSQSLPPQHSNILHSMHNHPSSRAQPSAQQAQQPQADMPQATQPRKPARRSEDDELQFEINLDEHDRDDDDM